MYPKAARAGLAESRRAHPRRTARVQLPSYDIHVLTGSRGAPVRHLAWTGRDFLIKDFGRAGYA